MSLVETPILTPKPLNPALFVGAASPLWGFYAAAAAGGVAFWWMTRWTQRVNLEALFGGKATDGPAVGFADRETAVALKALEPLVATVEATEIATEALVESAGEVAVETEAVMEAIADEAVETWAEAAAVGEAAVETVAEPAVDVAPEPPLAADALIEVATPKARKPKLAAAEPGVGSSPPAE